MRSVWFLTALSVSAVGVFGFVSMPGSATPEASHETALHINPQATVNTPASKSFRDSPALPERERAAALVNHLLTMSDLDPSDRARLHALQTTLSN